MPKLIIFAIDRCAEVSCLGVDAEHLCSCGRVNVLAPLECLTQLRLARHVRQDAQLDLRVVGAQQAMALLGDEGAADLAAEVGAHRDRLQVRVQTSRAGPSRRRSG